MTNDSLGDRMKGYECAFRHVLPMRMPVIIRVDGKSFHRWTKGMEKPFDEKLTDAMDLVAKALCEQIQGAQMAYLQSDEISVLVVHYQRLNSDAWFDNQIQKIASVSAGIASSVMTQAIKPAVFDARAFVLPEAEVTNYFLWRQQDATRNSVQMLARSLASHSECNGLNCSQLQELCFQRGKNWNDVATRYKRGRCVVRVPDGILPGRTHWAVDNEIPIWKHEGREYVEQRLRVADAEE